MGMPTGGLAGGGLGIVGLILALLFGGNVFGGGGGFDVGYDVDQFPGMPSARGGNRAIEGAPDPDADLKDFLGFVVEDVQQSWEQQFRAAGRSYQRTTLVLFEEATPTGCGTGTAQIGPFYCPADSKIYLDMGFFRDLQSRFAAPGDFAQAYVVAHEFGHHVQNLLGISDQVHRAQQRRPSEANELSVRLELQADCLAGVWGHSAYSDQLLEQGDLEEGLNAAAAVGDDRIQQQAGGRVNPETWTHGSAADRSKWFRKGFDSGDIDSCDTFS